MYHLAMDRPEGPPLSEQTIRDWCRENELGRVADDIASLAIPGWQLLPEEGAGRSHLGGEPDMPEGWDWPHREGVPLSFILQLELAGQLGLWGLLYFFWDEQSCLAFSHDKHLLLHQNGGSLHRHKTPRRPYGLERDYVFEETPIRLRPITTLPALADRAIQRLSFSEREEEAYIDLVCIVQPDPDMHLGGAGHWICADGREECSALGDDCACAAKDWQLVLELASTGPFAKALGWAGGSVYILAPKAQLDLGRIDDCRLVLQWG